MKIKSLLSTGNRLMTEQIRRQHQQLSSRSHCGERRKMSWHNSHIYFPSHLSHTADPLRLIFLSVSARASLMLYNVDKSHYGVCVNSGGSCIDYSDRQNAGREWTGQIHVLLPLSISAVNCQLNGALHHHQQRTAGSK